MKLTKNLMLATLAAIILISCHRPDTGSNTPPDRPVIFKQSILFEVEYINFAWGYSHRGFCIDSSGNVVYYEYHKTSSSYGDIWKYNSFDTLTQAELDDKYSHNPNLVKKIDKTLLSEKFRLAIIAAKGELSAKQGVCADAGNQYMLAYNYDAAKGVYYKIYLRVTGDIAFRNKTPEAIQLVKWLETIDDRFAQSGCNPFGE